MKKLITLAVAITLATSLHAFEPRRIFEIGVTGSGGAATNLISIADIFYTPDGIIRLDLNKIASDLYGAGLIANGNADLNINADLNLKNLRLGAFLNVEANTYVGLPQMLIDIIANGNAPNTPYSGSIDLRGDAYASIGAHGYMKFGKLGIDFRPSFYMPIAYIGNPQADLAFQTASDGTVTLSADVSIPVYSSISPAELEAMEDPNELINKIFQNGGIDVTASADYILTDEWTVGASLTNVPVAPAQVNYKTTINASGSIVIDNMLQTVVDNIDDIESISEEDFGLEYSYEDPLTVEEPTSVFRPFKFGLNAIYRPGASKLFAVRPNLALAIYDADTVYMDIGADAQLNLINLLFVNYGINYSDQIWKQHLGFIFNLRILELGVDMNLQSADFLGIFTAKGIGVNVAVKIGF
jgi:hypothetical protein